VTTEKHVYFIVWKERRRTMKKYLGVDLHRNCFTVCSRTRSGVEEMQEWSIHHLGGFAKTVKKVDEVAVEATGNTRFFTQALKDRSCRIVVVNPHEFQVISRSVKKTDEHDAKVLAEFLSKGMLPEVRMKDRLQAQIGSLLQTRDKLVKLRTILKNKINNMLSGQGILLKKESLSSEKGLEQVLKADVDEIQRVELEVLVEQIRHLNGSIAKLEGTIGEQGPKLPGWKNLQSIKGIGQIGAAIMLATIGNVHDFADEGKLAAYFGIVPRVSDSNETERRGRITKRGNKLGRTALVQCALIAIRYNPYLQTYYRRMAARRGTGKAIIALSRKFLSIIYKTLKYDWIFEDFPQFVLANG
jgi:transposase